MYSLDPRLPFHTPLPKVGARVVYCWPSKPVAAFTVVEVDSNTGCIYLQAVNLEEARRALAVDDKDKNGQPIKTMAFAWVEKRGLFAVNVAWDAWRYGVKVKVIVVP